MRSTGDARPPVHDAQVRRHFIIVLDGKFNVNMHLVVEGSVRVTSFTKEEMSGYVPLKD